MYSCQGCKGINKCIRKDSFNEIYSIILTSKCIVLESPVYVGMPSSLLLAFIQRATMVSFNNNGTLAGKNGGVIVVGGEAGHIATINDLTNFFLVNNMMIIGSNYWNIGVASKKGDIENDNNSRIYIENYAMNIKKQLGGSKYE